MNKPTKPAQYFPSLPDGLDPRVRQSLELLWERVNFLVNQLSSMPKAVAVPVTVEQRLTALQFALQAVSDQLTQGTTFASFGQSQTVAPTDAVSVSGSGDGLQLTGNTSAIVISVSSASALRSAANAAEKATPAITAATIPLAKITGGGVDGSITVNAEGIVTAYVAPT